MKSILEFRDRKKQKRPISMVTCYDHWTAKILKKTDVDCLLVGDSVAMVAHGHPNTLQASLPMMALHTQAVARANTEKLIVTDLPFLAHRKGKVYLMHAVDRLMKAGANALKIETAPGQEKTVRYIIQSGVPVIGHVGLTPQYFQQFGGYKVQGKTPKSHRRIIDHALKLEDAGVHAIVLECVPMDLAQELTERLAIPTIGIGAGLKVDGQVLVLQDLLGMNAEFKPRFVRQFSNGQQWILDAMNSYTKAINEKTFPSREETFL